MDDVLIENGSAKVAAGEWLMAPVQPAAFRGQARASGQKGFFVRDRASVRIVKTDADAWCSSGDRPFLTRLAALPDEPLHLVSAKLLVAPIASRVKAWNLKLIPMSLRRSTVITDFKLGWVVAATKSRVNRVSIEEGETLSVRPESLVAWIGPNPTGFCPRLSIWDIIFPRGPKNMSFTFHGPATVWFEGSQSLRLRAPYPLPPNP